MMKVCKVQDSKSEEMAEKKGAPPKSRLSAKIVAKLIKK